MTQLSQIGLVSLLAAGLITTPAYAREVKIIGIDISDSVPITINQNIALAAGDLIERMVAVMQPGDEVKLRSIGTAGISVEQINLSVTVGRKARERADRLAPQIGNVIRSLPDRVEAGHIQVQTSTNIIGFVETIAAPSLDCESEPGTLVLFTDGIEWSPQVLGRDLLAGDADLPAPSGQILKGCTVEMYGVGQQASSLGTDSRWFLLLRDQWRTFFEAAGVARFSAFAAFD